MKKPLLEIAGYSWRPVVLGDAAQLLKFEAACGRLDGGSNLQTLAEWQTLVQADGMAMRSSIAVNEAGEVAAAGWFEVADRIDSVHGFLVGRVHPDFRGQGIGTALLSWLETQAQAEMAQIANGRSQFLRLIFYDCAPDAIALFAQHGYEKQYAEDEYRFDLKRPLSPSNLSQNLASELVWQNWTPENAADFYATYRAAFATRTDHLMAADAWAHHFANPDDETFRPALSLLLKRVQTLLGYVVVHVETPGEGWLTQIGVNAQQRRQGWGAEILRRVLQNLTEAGMAWALLQVNQDNPQARALYERMGFEKVKTLYAYRKRV